MESFHVFVMQKSLSGPKGECILKMEEQILELLEFKTVEIETQLHEK